MFFKDKVCWITGASSGIGEALCQALAEEGAIIILSSRNKNNLEKVKLGLKNAERHLVIPFDLDGLTQERIDCLVEDAWSYKGRVDYLFNNGGISQRAMALDTQLAVDRKIMEVDYFAPIGLTKTLLTRWLECGGGTVVNIASIAGKIGVSMRTAYCGAKHALIGFMDSLRNEVCEQGVQVINVCPGFVKTNLSQNALKGDMSNYAQLDHEIANGMPVDVFVVKMLRGIKRGRAEIIIANGLPWLGYHAKRLFPALFLKWSSKLYRRKH